MNHFLFPFVLLATTSTTAVTPIDFEKQIWPMVQKSCIQCHGQDKSKAGLRLDLPELFTKNEHILKPKNPEDSEFYYRIILDNDDGDLMPPGKSGKRFSKAQTNLIKQWIMQGGNFGKWMAIVELSKSQKDAINALRKKGIYAVRLGDRLRDIRIDYRFTSKLKPNDFKIPQQISSLVTQLNLSKQMLSPQTISNLLKLKNLEKLNLSSTNINDIGLKKLKSLKKLQSLNLYNTEITQNGLKPLSRIKSLRKLYIAKTKITKNQQIQLSKSFRKAQLIGDWEAPSIPPKHSPKK